MSAAGLRSIPILTHLTSGITRLRDKGGASPAALYDLLNGYVDISGSPRNRDGTTVDHTLTAGTVGLCAFKGKLNVFALTAISMPAGYVCNILIHPDPAFAGTLVAIPFAQPFLGYLYVVAVFSDGSIHHYWLQSIAAWTANTPYQTGQNVQPTTPNGFLYSPTSANNPPAWAPNVSTAVGAVVQPTIYNGYQYTCIEVDGTSPATGTTEPAWPAAAGATVNDDNVAANTSLIPTETPPTTGSPAGPRYNNLPGVMGL